MKNRDTTIIYWELLRTMAAEPQLPSRLARVANVPYNRLGDYLQFLTAGGLARVESTEGHERYSITPKGMEALNYLDSALKILFQALG